MVGAGNESSVQAVLNDLESCTFFFWGFITYPVQEFTPANEDSIPFTLRRSLGLWMAFCFTHFPLQPFFTIPQSEEKLDNNINSISFPPYLEVFVGILRFLQIHHQGFWKVEGWILTKICLSSPLYSKISCFLLQ